jgi:MFS-type transporter involved in bile tolerance (Atg22 family)
MKSLGFWTGVVAAFGVIILSTVAKHLPLDVGKKISMSIALYFLFALWGVLCFSCGEHNK